MHVKNVYTIKINKSFHVITKCTKQYVSESAYSIGSTSIFSSHQFLFLSDITLTELLISVYCGFCLTGEIFISRCIHGLMGQVNF
jgi:hypothetical protein